MHEIGTHVIDIQISENTTIIYSMTLKSLGIFIYLLMLYSTHIQA